MNIHNFLDEYRYVNPINNIIAFLSKKSSKLVLDPIKEPKTRPLFYVFNYLNFTYLKMLK